MADNKLAVQETKALAPHLVTPMDLLQMAISKEGSIDVIERLAKLQMDFTDREDKISFRAAMTKFKEDMPKIIRSRSIVDKQGEEKYKAVALEDVAEPVMKALVKLGITYRYKTADLPDGRTRVTCILGMQGTAYEEEGSTLAAPPDTSGGKDALKAVGATVSYLEKYTLMASVGLHVYGADPEAGSGIANGITEADVVERVTWMQNAKTMPELVKFAEDAYKLAVKLRDDAAKKTFEDAYYKRKEELNAK